MSEQGGLYFSYKDKETVKKLKSELNEELDLLLVLKNTLSPLTIRAARWIGIPMNDHHQVSDKDKPVLDRHRNRHECHINDLQHIYELTYYIEGKLAKDTFTTCAISEEQARGLLEDHILRDLNMSSDASPTVTYIKDYGTQPIAWCIDWSLRMIEDVENKDRQANGN